MVGHAGAARRVAERLVDRAFLVPGRHRAVDRDVAAIVAMDLDMGDMLRERRPQPLHEREMELARRLGPDAACGRQFDLDAVADGSVMDDARQREHALADGQRRHGAVNLERVVVKDGLQRIGKRERIGEQGALELAASGDAGIDRGQGGLLDDVTVRRRLGEGVRHAEPGRPRQAGEGDMQPVAPKSATHLGYPLTQAMPSRRGNDE